MRKKKKPERKGMTRKQAYEHMVHHAKTLDLFEIDDQGQEDEYFTFLPDKLQGFTVPP